MLVHKFPYFSSIFILTAFVYISCVLARLIPAVYSDAKIVRKYFINGNKNIDKYKKERIMKPTYLYV